MLKFAGKIALAVALFGGGLGIGTMITSGANGLVDQNAPGTVNDPIVTKSYVDEAIKSLTGQAPTTGGTTGVAIGESKLEIVTVKPGQLLAGGEGTEFIVRAGRPVVYSTTPDGLSDLTDGNDIKSGKEIPLNHLMLTPRESRGIHVHKDSKASLVVLVRGSYALIDLAASQ